MDTSRYLFFLVLFQIVKGDIGYSGFITLGPNYYFVGINLNMSDFSENVTFNILEPDDPTYVEMTIQNAFDTMSANGGGVIHILEGEYIIMKNLNIQGNGIQLQGDGIDKTILKLSNYSVPFASEQDPGAGFIWAHFTTGLILSNLTLDGNKDFQYTESNYTYGRYGVFTETCTHVWFDSVKITNFQEYGFDPHGFKNTSAWSQYLTISNCVSTNNGWDGYAIDQTMYVYIINSLASNNGRHGFNVVTGSKYLEIINNTANDNGFDLTVSNSGGCGFTIQNNFLYGTSDTTFTNNLASYNKRSGFCLNDVYNINITNNLIEGYCSCENMTSASCICFNIINVTSTSISENVCESYKLYTEYDCYVIFGSGSGNYTYIYNNVVDGSSTCSNDSTTVEFTSGMETGSNSGTSSGTSAGSSSGSSYGSSSGSSSGSTTVTIISNANNLIPGYCFVLFLIAMIV